MWGGLGLAFVFTHSFSLIRTKSTCAYTCLSQGQSGRDGVYRHRRHLPSTELGHVSVFDLTKESLLFVSCEILVKYNEVPPQDEPAREFDCQSP